MIGLLKNKSQYSTEKYFLLAQDGVHSQELLLFTQELIHFTQEITITLLKKFE